MVLSFAFFSCASNSKDSKQVAAADSYNEDDQIAEPASAEEKETLIERPKEKSTLSSTMKDIFTFGNKNNFIRADVATVFTSTFTGSIKQQNAKVLVHTKEELAGFGSQYMTAYYIVMLDQENREKLQKAYDLYLQDFDSKRLNRTSKKTYKQYGKINTTLYWGTLESSTPNHGTGAMNVGYEFKNNSPYFVITNLQPFENEHYKVVGDSTSRESMCLKYYFTKAQMRDLLERISTTKINEALTEYFNLYGLNQGVVEGDDYLNEEEDYVEEIEE